jgi:hypothetical protein
MPIANGSSIGRMCEEVPLIEPYEKNTEVKFAIVIISASSKRSSAGVLRVEQIVRFFKDFQHVTQIIEVAAQREASGEID